MGDNPKPGEQARGPKLREGAKVGDFTVVKLVGSGGYGDCYAVLDSEDDNLYAMKIEFTNQKRLYLHTELRIMKIYQGSPFFPVLHAEGFTDHFRYIVMELFGPSISMARRVLPNHKYGAYSVLRLSLEMLNCIYAYHERGYTHRDIKPGNFLIRPDRNSPIVLIDYGLSIPYMKDGRHIRFREEVGFTGTCRYASLHAHEGLELSRRDDLISWFYSVVELADGSVPWPGSQDKLLTAHLKRTISTSQLCASLPTEFQKIYNYLLKLKFEQEPDYKYIAKLIVKAMKNGVFTSYTFDWEKVPADKMSSITSIPLDMGPEPDNMFEDGPLVKNTKGQCCTVC